METTDKTMKFDEPKTRQLIMALVCNKIRKNNVPKKYSDMLKATLKAIPMTVLMDFVTVVDSRPFIDVDRVYGYLENTCNKKKSLGGKDMTNKVRVKQFNDWKPDVDGVWRSKGLGRGMHSQRTRKEWGSAANPARTNRG